MKVGIAGGLAMLVGVVAAAGAHAQDAPPPDAERLRLAEQVVEAASGGAVAMVSKIFDGVTAQAAKDVSPDQQARFAETQTFTKARVTYYLPQILHAQAVGYAREFTAPQLTDILAFYRSPTGQALQARLPQVTLDMLQSMGPVLRNLQRDVLAHQCATTTCTDAQKAALAKLQAAAG